MTVTTNTELTNFCPDSKLNELCESICSIGSSIQPDCEVGSLWPHEQLRLASQYGVHEWFVPEYLGGRGWSADEIVAGYLLLSSACLTTTFIMTQRAAAIKRIANSSNEGLRDQLIEGILNREAHATVGISHLTTSRRHIGKPALQARESASGFVLNGFSPWVTGAIGAEYIVTGAELPDGLQILLAVPKQSSGVTVEPGFSMLALTASQTGPIRFDEVEIDRHWLLAGPAEDVLSVGSVSATGGFQTSALATGLAMAAVDFIQSECSRRSELRESHDSLRRQLDSATQNLLELAKGNPVCSSEELRSEANSLVLRSTQAALVAAKGAGFVEGHPVGRWCREAMFFLVWSCPQAVANANLCEFAGIES